MKLEKYTTEQLETALQLARRFQSKHLGISVDIVQIIEIYDDFSDSDLDTSVEVFKAADRYYMEDTRGIIEHEISRRKEGAEKLERMAEAYWNNLGPGKYKILTPKMKTTILESLEKALEAGGYKL